MHKFLLLCLFSVFIFTSLSAFPSSNQNKKLTLNKIDSEIKIDGIIDPIWAAADSISDFYQLQPYPNTLASKRTVAKLLTTDQAIYCLMICYDDPKNVTIQAGTLDEFSGDIVSVMFDTFGDNRTAYKFAVSASGVRGDSRLLDDARNRDYNWDGIWFADSEIYDWGFVVEMEIPYKSLQYEETLTEWGLDFDRWVPSNSEDIYWINYEENEGQRISKFGKLDLNGFTPQIDGLNLEIFPVGISSATYVGNNEYDYDADIGLDVFYNPSPKLTFQATANPDFAQIEADPFSFNISRFESYFSERRPFFVKGQEIFTASGRQRNTGFYRPMELFYPRRIGKKLPDGSEVPLTFGAKAFGRVDDWEYGSLVARTAEAKYTVDGVQESEKQAIFAVGRVSKQIFENSSIGVLYAGKYEEGNSYGILDIDGGLRGDDWQLAYQFARSFKNADGDFALSAGFTQFKENWMTLARTRYVGSDFDVSQIGFVPWRGNSSTVAIAGPRWVYDDGAIRSILLYGGPALNWQKEDNFTDYSAVFGFNMQFRNNWGYEINVDFGKSRDLDVEYSSHEFTISSWFPNPNWSGNLYGGYSKTYNFSRDYLAFYSWVGAYFSWNITSNIDLGTSYDMYVEGNPAGNVEDITYNARPFFSITPVNDLNIRIYVDNLYIRSSKRMERIIAGFLFSYNFSPKSWIYLAINEIHDRSDEYDALGNLLPNSLHLKNRAGVAKVSYLYYF
ncbi:MAG: carbohydrate binding family 9 domain-containing protein [Melioribacteraceae bacterium]|nr:carbohydrate binding family 9 domain-containing protein [Melioribacteraceae bacterium]MCF8263850.1 carbohydrate binding family 9 domain-containing protein [Melioribacteraceae bacterium]MCF8413253.1 carbohydrate binding family 9 domain-containing protein [Melioribacteraceae bacterium]